MLTSWPLAIPVVNRRTATYLSQIHVSHQMSADCRSKIILLLTYSLNKKRSWVSGRPCGSRMHASRCVCCVLYSLPSPTDVITAEPVERCVHVCVCVCTQAFTINLYAHCYSTRFLLPTPSPGSTRISLCCIMLK